MAQKIGHSLAFYKKASDILSHDLCGAGFVQWCPKMLPEKLVEHRVPVVDVPALLLDLLLPLALLVAEPVYHRLGPSVGPQLGVALGRSGLRSGLAAGALVIGSALVVVLAVVDGAGRWKTQPGALVEDGVEARQESHVDDQDGNHPDDQDNNHLDDGEAAGLPLARAARTKGFGLGIGDVQVRHDNVLAVAVLGTNLKCRIKFYHVT